jgi:hypothetical protein
MTLKALALLALVVAVLLTSKLALVIAVALEVVDGILPPTKIAGLLRSPKLNL